MKNLCSDNEVINARRVGCGCSVRLAGVFLIAQLSTVPARTLLRVPQALTEAKLARGVAGLSVEAAIQSAAPPREVVDLLHKARLTGNLTSSVHQFPGHAGGPAVSREEIAGAMKSLNLMALKAQERLDGKSLDCSGMQENNELLRERVQQDVDRIGTEQSAVLARLASARGSLGGVDGQRQTLRERHAEEDKVLERRFSSVQGRLLKTRENMRISEYLLDMTKCAGSALLLSGVKGASQLAGFKVCQRAGGSYEIQFEDARLQNLTSRLTPEGQLQLQLALGRSRLSSQDLDEYLLAKDGSAEILEDGDELTLKMTLLKAGRNPTKQPKYDEQKANRCTMRAKPSCGEMHDIFAGLWGDMKDTVDALGEDWDEMKLSKDSFGTSFQHELAALGHSQGMLEATLVDIKTSQAELSGELAGKARERDSLKQFASKTKQECASVIDEIVHGEMCGILKLRTELAGIIFRDPPVIDCKTGEWRKTSACSKLCGGGTQTFQREVVQRGSQLGTSCPALQTVRKCNDVACPVDCALSSWAPWSNCTQACGGGVRYRMRARKVNPKNGGFACDVLQETQQCNTGACDRNCRLGTWSALSSCSQACDTGFRARARPVLDLAIGAGSCPAKDSRQRVDRKECNKNKCNGDEMCVSKLDLVIAIDGSGSLTKTGFAILQTFAAKLVMRLRGGPGGVRAGVVQFGNGALDATKVVSDAIAALPLSTSVDSVATTLLSLPFHRGFTNLAQAAMKSRDLLNRAPNRAGAEKVVIFLTDGRPTFKHMASEEVQQLKSLARVMVVQVKPFPEKHNMELLRTYATEPAEVNYLHIAGKNTLKKAYDAFVTKLLVQTCQSVESPSAKKKQ